MDSAITCSGLGKRYGDLWATKDIDLTVERGTVHAVVGENGAGKSTLMKMIAGVVEPDTGTLAVKGMPITDFSPRLTARLGLGMVYQELMLAPTLTVWENIVLGWEPHRRGFVDETAARTAIEEMARRHHMPVPLDVAAGTLPISQQQQVEILRVLYRGADVIILDEPTSVLTPQEAQGLFETLRSLAAAGSTILFISHKLHEVLSVADTITVLRHGELIDSIEAASADRDSLARMIIGRDFEPIHRGEGQQGAVVLELDDVDVTSLGGLPLLSGVSLEVRAGSVLGVAGVAGSGQDELVGLVTGSVTASRGKVTVRTPDHPELRLSGGRTSDNVRALRDRGLAHVPADRNEVGTAATEGLWFSELAGKYWTRGPVGGATLDVAAARARSAGIVERYRVKTPSVDVRPRELSGGNLQKYILGRELSEDPSLIVAEEPTRGVDIGSAMAIRQEIRDRADAGAAVLLVSTDLDELLEISDDILVLFEGRRAGLFRRSDVDAITLGAAMTGLSDGSSDQPGEEAGQ